MAAARRKSPAKDTKAGKAAPQAARERPVRRSSRPATPSGGQTPVSAASGAAAAAHGAGGTRTAAQIEKARLAKNARERDRRARKRRDAEAAASLAAAAAAKPKAKGKAKKAPNGGRKARRADTVRFRPAAPEDFEAVERALTQSAEVVAREGKLTPQERVERDEGVVASLAMGLTVGTVARRVNLSSGQVEQILAASRDRYREQVPRGEAVLWDALRGLDANIEQAAQMAAVPEREGEGEAPPTPLRLGALKLKHELQTARLELLLAMGLISASPATYERERQARDYLLRLLEGLREAGVSDAVIERVASDAMPVDVLGDTLAAARRSGDDGRTITTA